MSQNVIDTVGLPVPDPSGDLREVRVMAGWLQPEEAVLVILGRPATSPEEAQAVMAAYTARRDTVTGRPPTPRESPIVTGDRALLDEVEQRPEVRVSFAPQPIRVEWVDLSRVASIQKLIYMDGLDERVAAAATDEAALVELCLPKNPGSEARIGFSPDADGRGFTFSSPNPNLRLQGSQMIDGTVTFGVGLGSPYLAVASYQGHYYLHNGNHRAVGLLARGVTTLPAVVFEVPTYDIVGGVGNPLFSHAVLTATTPPLVTDFLDDTVTIKSSRPRTQKILRLHADEFMIQS